MPGLQLKPPSTFTRRHSTSTPSVAQPSKKLKQSKLPWFVPVILALAIVTALISLTVALIFLNRPQDVRRGAQQVTDRVTLKLRGESRDGKLRVEVLLNSKNYNMAGLELRGSVQGVPTNQIHVTTSNELGLQQVVSELTEGTQSQTSAFFISLFAPLDPNQPATTRGSEKVVATFIIDNPPSSAVTFALASDSKAPVLDIDTIGLEIASSQSFTYSASTSNNSNSSTSDSSKKTCNQNCATDTECQNIYQCYKGQCRLRDSLDDANCTSIQDRGLQRGCNQYCADSRECSAGFSCYYNQCRNPLNVTSSTCSNPPAATVSRSTGRGGATSTSTNKGSTVAVKSSPSPTPKVIATNVKLDTATKSAKPASASPSARVTPKPTATVTPKVSPSVKPSVSPIPAEVTQNRTNNSTTVVLLLLVLVGVGGIGFALFKLLKR